MEQARDGLAAIERDFDALDRIVGGFASAVDYLAQFLVQGFLDRMIVVIDCVLRHAVTLDRVIVMVGRRGVGAARLGALGERFVLRGCLAPHFGVHAVIARAFSRRQLSAIDFEVLHAAAHVERQIEHPLLIVTLRSEIADHGCSGLIICASGNVMA